MKKEKERSNERNASRANFLGNIILILLIKIYKVIEFFVEILVNGETWQRKTRTMVKEDKWREK